MRKKNSSVARLKDANIYPKVKSVLTKYKKNNSFVVGVSGGPDSLALSALVKVIAQEKKYKFFFAMVDHGIRRNSGKEASQVKKLLSKHDINLEIYMVLLKSIIMNFTQKIQKRNKKIFT